MLTSAPAVTSVGMLSLKLRQAWYQAGSKPVFVWAGQLVLIAFFAALLVMVFMGDTDDTNDEVAILDHVKQRKAALTEEIRVRRLHALQKSIFQNLRRPADWTYNINVSLAESIPLEREVPDSRPPECTAVRYNLKTLPTISIIIPFYNEALSMLLRTVHSILSRTPPELLRDIILVNDHSPNEDLGTPLEQYVKLLPAKVRMVRTQKREGLIRARMIGARMTSGEVIMFQDAHTEVNVQWAEPLLYEIQKNPETVIQPEVDQIEAMTIQYIGSSGMVPRGGWSWDLRYTWMQIPDHEKARLWSPAQAFRTAALVGCALAVQKKYFYKIGSFDDGMNIWGGENIELAFRTWMCGGQVITAPCSRVAHVFKPFSYAFDGDREKIVQKNLMRIAELWMGDWKKFFYAATYSWEVKHTYFTEKDKYTLNKRRALKKKLGCKSFDWYMKTITPEIPTPPLDAWYFGEVANEKTEACLAMTKDGYLGMTYFCFFHRVLPENQFYIDTKGRLKYRDQCLRIESSTWLMRSSDCFYDHSKEYWDVIGEREVTGLIRAHIELQGTMHVMCIVQVTNVNKAHHREQMPQLGDCNPKNEFVHWRWQYKFNFKYDFGTTQ